MHRQQHAMMWAMVASGIAGRPGITAAQIADRTDEVLKEYSKRFPEEPDDDRYGFRPKDVTP